jgi:hypothetical protein
MKKLFLVLPLFLLGCATTITGGPPGQGPAVDPSSFLAKDLVAAAYNLDQAVLVGALPADDPAPACVHGVLINAGIELPPGTTAPASFEPKREGLVSAGSIAYIRVQQLKAASGKVLKVPVSCKALIGGIVVDGLTAPGRLVDRVGF